ncbi:MAG TPA: MAPEG family protein [Rhodocyclaceae bacterium]|nr:MAPEG family protein [Rhodocyclaceae bacterium]
MTSSLYGPMLALIAWTAGVGMLAARRRVREIRRRRIPLATLARPRDLAQALDDTQAMDNFNNLLQVPVLFHLCCLAFAQQASVPQAAAILAWVYVALRIGHSLIQLTHNRVLPRFGVWTAGNLVLMGLWGVFAAGLV